MRPPSLLRWLPATRPDNKDLLDVLHRGRTCHATDPRDKIHAHLGLLDQSISEIVSVDYSSSAVDIYISLATGLVVQQKSIEVLRYSSGQAINTELFPSWVHRWDVNSGHEPFEPQYTAPDIVQLDKPLSESTLPVHIDTQQSNASDQSFRSISSTSSSST